MLNHFRERDLHQRLHDTFVLYKGLPYYCGVVRGDDEHYDEDDGDSHGGYHLRLTSCINDTHIEVDPYHTDLDISSIPVGYYNGTRGVSFLRRKPIRQYPHKQTVGADTLVCRDTNKQPRELPPLRSTSFYDMVVGNYPSFKEAYQHVKNTSSPKAIHIHFCIGEDFSMLYKNEVIGKCISENKVYVEPSLKDFIYRRFLKKFNIEVTHENSL